MSRTFSSEDERKTRAFAAWNEYLDEAPPTSDIQAYDEIYEGMGLVSDLSKFRIGFHLEDGRKLRHIPVSFKISENSARLDYIYIVLGRRKTAWRVLDVISIGTLIPGKGGGAHITVNPLLMNSESQPPGQMVMH